MKPLPPLSQADTATLMQALTPTAREMVHVIGLAAVVNLVRDLGGQRIFLHVSEPPDSRITKSIGVEATALLSAFRGGHFFDVPMLTKVRRLLRDNSVRAGFDGGDDVNTLAARFELTARHTRKILGASVTTSPRQ